MKAVILAGGFGTRLSEATDLIPKPMVEIGGKPILWHIMKIYSYYGIHEFIICCGYKQYVIKEYFANYFRHNCDMTVDLSNNRIEVLDNHSENWKVTMIDTGLHTGTAGRIKLIEKYIGNDTFCLTYGDGVADVDISRSIESHQQSNKIVSMMAYQQGGKLGVLSIDVNGVVDSFTEKPAETGTWINAGFFICEPQIFDYIYSFDEMLEKEPLQRIVKDHQLHAYLHKGFWMPMDTLRDNKELNVMWNVGNAPWKKW